MGKKETPPEQSPPVATIKSVNGVLEFTVVLSKTPESSRIGMDVDIANGTCLVVEKVDGGAAEAWNESNKSRPDLQIQLGDKVMSINGTSGDATALTQVCKRDNVLEMKIQRPAK